MKKTRFYILYLILISIASHAQTNKDSIVSKVHTLKSITITEMVNRTTTIDTFIMRRLSIKSAVDAANIIAGITVSKNGARNESNIFVHGFDLKQSGVLLNNTPVNMPYDGYIDFIFKSFTISKISFNNMFSSFLDNSLSGNIKLETKKPNSKVEFQNENNIEIGNNGISKHSNGLYFGTKVKKWRIATAINYQKNRFIQLPKSFDKNSFQETLKLDNSESNNLNPYLYIEFAPKKNFAYSFSYFGLKANKQIPVYLGENPNIKQRFWRYPKWNMNNFTLNTKSKILKKLDVQTTWFYNVLKNTLKSYDDNTYKSQTKKYAFTSYYNDYIFGGKSKFALKRNKNNRIELHINHQTNRHRERAEDKIIDYKEGRLNLRFQDTYKITPNFTITGCIGRNLNILLTNTSSDSALDKTNRISDAVIKTFISYKPNNHIILLTGINKSSRFATMKERFSYRIGRALPNPDLKPENSINSEFKILIKYPKIKLIVNPYYYYTLKTIQQVDNVQDGLWQLQNTGKSSSVGIDFSASYNITSNMLIGSNYSFIEKKNITNPELMFVDIPKHKLIAYISYSRTNKIDVTAQYEYNSERKSTSDGQYKAPSFNLININANYKINRYFTASVGINNVFDALYYRTEGYSEEGRTFKASIKFNIISN